MRRQVYWQDVAKRSKKLKARDFPFLKDWKVFPLRSEHHWCQPAREKIKANVM